MPSEVRAGQDDDPVLQLHAEELAVERREVETGRVRVATTVRERQELIDELLTHHRVEIERVARDEAMTVVPAIREEGDTLIVPVVEEVLVIERRLMLKEEIRIRRVTTTERKQQPVTLRSEDVVVSRDATTPSNFPQPGPLGDAGRSLPLADCGESGWPRRI